MCFRTNKFVAYQWKYECEILLSLEIHIWISSFVLCWHMRENKFLLFGPSFAVNDVCLFQDEEITRRNVTPIVVNRDEQKWNELLVFVSVQIEIAISSCQFSRAHKYSRKRTRISISTLQSEKTAMIETHAISMTTVSRNGSYCASSVKCQRNKWNVLSLCARTCFISRSTVFVA